MKDFFEKALLVLVVSLYFILMIILSPFEWLEEKLTGRQIDMADEHSMDSGLKYEIKDYHHPKKKSE